MWDLYRIEQKNNAANTHRLDRAEAETLGEIPIPPSMVSVMSDEFGVVLCRSRGLLVSCCDMRRRTHSFRDL